MQRGGTLGPSERYTRLRTARTQNTRAVAASRYETARRRRVGGTPHPAHRHAAPIAALP